MPRFVGDTKKNAGRGRLYEKSRKSVLAKSQMCWICMGECPDFKWPEGKLPFDSAAIDMTVEWPHPASPSVDHKIPINLLPPDDPRLWRVDNLAPAHLKCNSARGDGTKGNASVPTKTSRNWLA